MIKYTIKNILAAMAAFTLLAGCSTDADSVLSKLLPDNTDDGKTPQATTVWTGYQSFSDVDWNTNLQVDASKFANLTNGDRITFYWSEISGAQYKKIQLDYMQIPWTELTGGSATGGTKESGENSAGYRLDSNPFSYKVTADNVSKLKAYGLAVMGYGFTITKISIVPEGASDSGNNGGNTGGTGNTEPTPVITKPEPSATAGTPFANHGALHVNGAYLYDSHNQKYMLYGMSTHGISFEGYGYGNYLNETAMKELVDDWNTNCIRIVMYPMDYNGYCNGGDKETLKKIVKNGIDAATNAGMYAIVDWHVHEYNPADTKDEAKLFLAEISKEYANYDNVLYEICNEPTGSPWDSVIKPYAEEVIPVIRENAPDAVIIVGTNTWSQDIEDAAKNPLPPATYGNIMYTFHFYADTHQSAYRTRVEDAIKGGLPVFITEFGTCDASGNGSYNKTQSEEWFKLCKTYNISHMNWSLCNKGETASVLKSGCSKYSGWTNDDLTESGLLIKAHFCNDCTK